MPTLELPATPAPPSPRTGTPHLAVLDGLRGLGVMAVFGFHLGYAVGWTPHQRPLRYLFNSVGTMGVETFFILSAFLLFLPTLRRGTFGSRRWFALRRVARVVPAYLLCLGVVIVLRPPILLPVGAAPDPDVRSILAHLTFTQNELLNSLHVGSASTAPSGRCRSKPSSMSCSRSLRSHSPAGRRGGSALAR